MTDVVFVSDAEIATLIKDMLSHAEEYVLIASPWMWGIDDIVQRLDQLRRKKVEIRILTRRSEETDKKHYQTVSQMYDIGCEIDFDDELHAKIVLIDDKELYIGSANLVATSLERNKEEGIYTNNRDTVFAAGDYLSDAFDEAFKKRMQK
jgi:cardiolipin synthase